MGSSLDGWREGQAGWARTEWMRDLSPRARPSGGGRPSITIVAKVPNVADSQNRCTLEVSEDGRLTFKGLENYETLYGFSYKFGFRVGKGTDKPLQLRKSQA